MSNHNQYLNLGLGVFVLIGGGIYAVNKIITRQRIYKNQKIYEQALKCNLNHLNLKRQTQIIKQGDQHFYNRLVAIENVISHFPQGTYPYVTFIQGKFDDFPQIKSNPFKIVQKTYNKALYSLYDVNVKDTFVSQSVLMPDIIFRNPNKSSKQSPSASSYTRLITSASSLGIIGTLKFADNMWEIDAKFIGCSLDQIRKYIESQKFYNSFGIFLGGIFVAGSLGFIIKTIVDMNRKRVPLEFSLLNTSS